MFELLLFLGIFYIWLVVFGDILYMYTYLCGVILVFVLEFMYMYNKIYKFIYIYFKICYWIDGKVSILVLGMIILILLMMMMICL